MLAISPVTVRVSSQLDGRRLSALLLRPRRLNHTLRSTSDPMNVHVVGAGSAGCLIAYHLQDASERQKECGTVTLQLRRPPSEASTGAKDVTITIDDSKEQRVGQRRLPWQCAASSSPIDILLVTTKADQTIEAVRPLLPLLARRPSPATIILTQNGMGVDEALESLLDFSGLTARNGARPHVVLGINRQGTWSKQRFHTVHAGKGDLPFAFSLATENALGGEKEAQTFIDAALIGNNSSSAASLGSLSNTINLLCSPHMVDALGTRFELSARTFSVLQQQKLVSNCVLNPLTALYGIRNGECGTRADVRLLGERIIDECACVFAARYAAARSSVPAQLSADALHTYVWDIVRLLGGNWSSMVQDMWTKRGSTEIDFLNGTIVRWAGEVGVNVPLNARMAQEIRRKAAHEAKATADGAAKDGSHGKA